MRRMMRTSTALVALIAGFVGAPSNGQADSIVVIVNKENPVDNASLADLARIYNGTKTRWPDGSQILAIDRPEDASIRAAFYRIVLRAEPGKVFYQTGSPVPFKTLHQQSAMGTKRLVARMANAIGYIYRTELDDSVKALTIDGASPREAAAPAKTYPLQE